MKTPHMPENVALLSCILWPVVTPYFQGPCSAKMLNIPKSASECEHACCHAFWSFWTEINAEHVLGSEYNLIVQSSRDREVKVIQRAYT